MEENPTNKTPLLLKYNPIHKRVVVLVHNGKYREFTLIWFGVLNSQYFYSCFVSLYNPRSLILGIQKYVTEKEIYNHT